ncbi:MAG: acetolactate synthase large subunit [Candidatus Promineifilaceae bacterium]
MKNGAQNLIRTLVSGGVDVCFTNPGTSEMHFVAALDQVDGMRAVLCLFEGVCTGAADAYGRMMGKPASTLLHLGPGMGNGIANLHNARRAQSPIVNIIGEHATYHIELDAPLTTDIEGIAQHVSKWVRTTMSPDEISRDTADAITASLTDPGQIATLILPGDSSWNPTTAPILLPQAPPTPTFDMEAVRHSAEIIRRGEPTLILMAGKAVLDEGAAWASRIAAVSEVELMSNRPTARRQLGVGRPIIKALAYPVDQSLRQLQAFKHIILVGTAQPVAFFAYPNKPGTLAPEGCELHTLAGPNEDLVGALAALAQELGASAETPLHAQYRNTPPPLPTGALTIPSVWQSVAAQLPDQAIIVNESLTSGRGSAKYLSHAPQHDMLYGTGGAIGHGLPQSIGAAVACPDRQVINMQADGSAMYTISALWTFARENLDIVSVIWNNRAYKILQGELDNVGAIRHGTKADSILNLDNPQLDFVKMAEGMGVEASRADSADAFNDQFAAALAKKGPHLIEVLV